MELTTKQTAGILGCSVSAVRGFVKAGKLADLDKRSTRHAARFSARDVRALKGTYTNRKGKSPIIQAGSLDRLARIETTVQATARAVQALVKMWQ